MILWINGAFGVGKTQTAYELSRRLPGSVVYDPENIGYFLKKNLPDNIREDDFQDIPLWREWNSRLLLELSRRHEGYVIVPMTITNPDYYQQITGELLAEGYGVTHFILTADKRIILRRLRKRFESGRGWAAQQIDRCISAFGSQIKGRMVDTNQKTISEVAEEIAGSAGVLLLPDRRSTFVKACGRLWMQIKHII